MYTISARKKPTDKPIHEFISTYFSHVASEIDSVFGFTDYTPLYGGRAFKAAELSASDIAWMYDNNIGYRIPLTNKFATEVHFEASRDFLEKYHREGNTIITSSVWLAKAIREAYPLYRLESSIMMKPMCVEDIVALLEVFDSVVLHPMWYLKQDIHAIPCKERIVWFTALGCLYNCPDDSCQRWFSRHNLGLPQTEVFCSQTYSDRTPAGYNYFSVDYLKSLGFSRFKMMRQDEAFRVGDIKCILPRYRHIGHQP